MPDPLSFRPLLGMQAARKKKSRRSQPEVEAEQVVEREENRGVSCRSHPHPASLIAYMEWAWLPIDVPYHSCKDVAVY